MPEPRTAFPRTEENLRRTYGSAPLVVETLRRPLLPCDLSVCRGMCCHDGVYLDDEEAEVVVDLARLEAEFFRSIGLTLPDEVVVAGSFQSLVEGPKTATVPRYWRDVVPGYPAHFGDTACCFLMPDGRCSLQMLSESRGRHRWFYKPTGCWMHPLTTDLRGDAPIGLHDEASDPFRLPLYEGFVSRTFCGRCSDSGPPAYETLREELSFLGEILGRDPTNDAKVARRTS